MKYIAVRIRRRIHAIPESGPDSHMTVCGVISTTATLVPDVPTCRACLLELVGRR